MARLSRKLRVCKCVGTVGCALVLAAFVFSGWRQLSFVWPRKQYLHSVWLSEGSIGYGRLTGAPWHLAGWYLWPLENPGWPQSSHGMLPSYGRYGADIGANFPLWIPYLAMFVPTLLLWRRDRRKPRAGLCPYCGYDLTGNVSGVCPECGSAISENQRVLLARPPIEEKCAAASSSPQPVPARRDDGVGHAATPAGRTLARAVRRLVRTVSLGVCTLTGGILLGLLTLSYVGSGGVKALRWPGMSPERRLMLEDLASCHLSITREAFAGYCWSPAVDERNHFLIHVTLGRICVSWRREHYPPLKANPRRHWSIGGLTYDLYDIHHLTMGLTGEPIWDKGWFASDHWVTAPLWLPVLALLSYPLLAIVSYMRRRRRPRAGACRSCGYDLTGNVSGVCPECGSAVNEERRTRPAHPGGIDEGKGLQ